MYYSIDAVHILHGIGRAHVYCSISPVRLKIEIYEIHEIHLICEIHIPKCRNPVHFSEIHCLKVERIVLEVDRWSTVNAGNAVDVAITFYHSSIITSAGSRCLWQPTRLLEAESERFPCSVTSCPSCILHFCKLGAVRAWLFGCRSHYNWQQVPSVCRQSWVDWTNSLGVACWPAV